MYEVYIQKVMHQVNAHTRWDNGQHFLRWFSFLLWCRQLLIQGLQLVFVFQQVSRLKVIDIQGQILAQYFNLKLQVQLERRLVCLGNKKRKCKLVLLLLIRIKTGHKVLCKTYGLKKDHKKTHTTQNTCILHTQRFKTELSLR